MTTYEIHHIDSFTNTIFGGNPTVTVLNADTLTDEKMKQIAKEMNLSETGFVLTSKKADIKLRFFTPNGDEIKFCGHATVGALCTIAKQELFNCTQVHNQLTIETNAGILSVEIDLSNKNSPKYILDAPKIDLVSSPYSLNEIIVELGINPELIDLSKPAMLEKTNNYIYLVASDLTSLEKINLDFPKTIKFAQRDKIVVFCILTKETFDKSYDIHARGFAPLVGVPEDPFTGSMQGGIAAYARSQGMIDKNKKWIGVEQGHFMDRPGFVKLEIIQPEPLQVRLHGEAVHIFSAKINIK